MEKVGGGSSYTRTRAFHHAGSCKEGRTKACGMYSSAFVPPGQILHRLLQRAQKADCILGRGVCVWGASSSIPMQGLAKPSQICNQSFTCESHQPSAYVLLRLSRIFILRGIFIVMGELFCNSAVFCYFELVLARESNPSRICLLQRFKSQSLILAPVPRKKSYMEKGKDSM